MCMCIQHDCTCTLQNACYKMYVVHMYTVHNTLAMLFTCTCTLATKCMLFTCTCTCSVTAIQSNLECTVYM